MNAHRREGLGSSMNDWTKPAALFAVLTMVACEGPAPDEVQPYAPYTNLQVLPEDITWPELEGAMLDNLTGLGLRRTSGEGCLFCHVGSPDTDMETWDFATDSKRRKRTARTMMRMVRTINETFLTDLASARSPSTKVTCNTCHKGRTNPRPLPEVLRRSYRRGGLSEVERDYRRLRREYFGRGAYDFSGALVEHAIDLADQGEYDDAIGALEVEIDVAPESVSAHRWLIRLVVERAIQTERESHLSSLIDSLTAVERPAGAFVWFTLRSVGVRLQRAGKLPEARTAFVLNDQIYRDDPRIIMDLARVDLALADTSSAIGHARRALAIDSSYEAAIDLLEDMRAR